MIIFIEHFEQTERKGAIKIDKENIDLISAIIDTQERTLGS